MNCKANNEPSDWQENVINVVLPTIFQEEQSEQHREQALLSSNMPLSLLFTGYKTPSPFSSSPSALGALKD